jgi:hypothetical protein
MILHCEVLKMPDVCAILRLLPSDNAADPGRQRLIGHGPMSAAVAPPGFAAKVSVNGNFLAGRDGPRKDIFDER